MRKVNINELEEMKELKKTNVSMGIMLENVSERLTKKGMPHYLAASKKPQTRLKILENSGKLGIPMTTGILVGIGETIEEIIDSILAIKGLHEKYKKNSVVIDGRMSKDRRQDSVDRFQNEDKIKIFIGNIKAAGVGITLTAADTVIMNDLSFVPADHSQAEDRAYRYGQKNSVLVYYPIFENTIEKIVYNMLQKKKGIIDQVMGDGEYSESFSKDLLKSLL